ncbi:MAG TPA: alpha/beta hydrolase [Candidatus Nitrosotalea sp.]|nr:alpha/beta hydrolase [Candidatus Nitrosotalea sp.]
MQTKFAEVWGHKIRYLEEGRSDKSIILIHGLGGSAERWLKVIPRLSSKYRVIAPDMIGFGYSDKPSEDYTIDFFAKFLSAFINSTGLKSTILVGTSLGGQIAAHCASINDSVEKIVLVAPSGAMKSPTPAIDAYMMAALYPNHTSAREAFEMMSRSGTVDDFTVSDFVKRMSMPNAKLAFISSVLGIKNSNIEESLKKIMVPTLVMWGKHDKVIPIQHADQFVSSIKDCTFLELDECGHLPHVEVPDVFSDSVLEFLGSRLVMVK